MPALVCLQCGEAVLDTSRAFCERCRSLPTGVEVTLTVGQQVWVAHEGKLLRPGVFIITRLEPTALELRVTVRARDSGQTYRYPSTCCVPVAPGAGVPPVSDSA